MDEYCIMIIARDRFLTVLHPESGRQRVPGLNPYSSYINPQTSLSRALTESWVIYIWMLLMVVDNVAHNGAKNFIYIKC